MMRNRASEPAEGGERYIVRSRAAVRLCSYLLCALLLVTLAALFYVPPAASAVLLPNGEQTFVDANGAPLAGGSVYFYVPTTTNFKTTWKDSGQSITNVNPVLLDSAGRAIIYGQGTYRQVVKDALGVTQWDQLTSDGAASNPAIWGGSATGTPNAIVVAANGFNSTDGQVVSFRATATNTGPTTLNAGTGLITVQKDLFGGPAPLIAGDIVTSNDVFVVYDATSGTFHIINLIFPSSPALAGVPTAPTASVGTNTTQIATTAFVAAAATASPGKANRNRITNGNFQVNQRQYASGTATASGTYMLDDWRSGQAASTMTFGTLTAAVNTITVAGLVQQVVENLYIEGGAYTLSWVGTSQCREAQGASPAAALAALAGGYSTSPLAVASITAGNYAIIECNGGTLASVQLEPGTVATSYEVILFNEMLLRCLRYYEKSFPYATAPVQNAGVDNGITLMQIVGAAAPARYFFPYKVPKPPNATITVTIFNPSAANAQIRNLTTATDFTATSGNFGITGFSMDGTSPGGSALGNQISGNWTVDSGF